MGAVKKYVRRDYLFIFLKEIEGTGVNMTPTLAKQILELWTGHGADWKALLKAFGSPGRTAKRKSKDFEQVFEIAEKWKAHALNQRLASEEMYQRAKACVVLKNSHRSFKPMEVLEPLQYKW